MSVELGLAVLGTVDMCLRCGKKLVDLCRSIRRAHDEVDSTLLRLESIWNKTSVQLHFMRSLSAKLPDDYARIQQQLLEKLTGALSAAIVKLESVLKMDADGQGFGVKAVKYAFLKDSIDHTVRELRDWQVQYDPTWFLVVLIHDNLIDTLLGKLPVSNGQDTNPISIVSHLRGLLKGSTDNIHINLDGKDFDLSNATTLKYTTTKILSRGTVNSEKSFLIDTLYCNNYVDVDKAKRNSENLARRLKVINPETFWLLRCHGLVKTRVSGTKELASIHFVFRMPSPSPISLRDELLQPSPVSLTRVLHIAQCLAKSISFIHVCDFVHKNIRPETIITFPDGDTSPCDSAYLLGFDSFRDVNYQTLMAGDAAFERNLYRHPSRQGVNVQQPYTMQHDIYALGVCLLEIGLWASFVLYDDDGTPRTSDGLGRDAADGDFTGTPERRLKLKEHLVTLAQEKLPSRMGDKYTTVVVHCLTCLDLGNSVFNAESIRDEDGVAVGVRFIDKILLGLNGISV